jgi:hypothetical protein
VRPEACDARTPCRSRAGVGELHRHV